MVQSMGILRHVARKHGLYGRDNAEMARVEEVRELDHCPVLSACASSPVTLWRHAAAPAEARCHREGVQPSPAFLSQVIEGCSDLVTKLIMECMLRAKVSCFDKGVPG